LVLKENQRIYPTNNQLLKNRHPESEHYTAIINNIQQKKHSKSHQLLGIYPSFQSYLQLTLLFSCQNKEEQDIIKYRNKKSGSLKVCILAA
jgi:hypothetical protein